MKAEIKNTYECPFSDSHCFKLDTSLVIKDGMKYNEVTGKIAVCPFFEVTNDNVETFEGICKIINCLDIYKNK